MAYVIQCRDEGKHIQDATGFTRNRGGILYRSGPDRITLDAKKATRYPSPVHAQTDLKLIRQADPSGDWRVSPLVEVDNDFY